MNSHSSFQNLTTFDIMCLCLAIASTIVYHLFFPSSALFPWTGIVMRRWLRTIRLDATTSILGTHLLRNQMAIAVLLSGAFLTLSLLILRSSPSLGLQSLVISLLNGVAFLAYAAAAFDAMALDVIAVVDPASLPTDAAAEARRATVAALVARVAGSHRVGSRAMLASIPALFLWVSPAAYLAATVLSLCVWWYKDRVMGVLGAGHAGVAIRNAPQERAVG